MKIAVLGAGYAGLSLSWHLLHESQSSVIVDIFDPLPIGSGASGYSSGLLHAYAGQHAKRSWEASLGMHATHDLISAAATAIASPLVLSHGILRPAGTEEQQKDFLKAAESNPDLEWWSQAKCLEKIPELTFPSKEGGGIFIKTGLTLHTKLYLEGLWQAIAKAGGRHIKTAVTSLEQIKKYDRIVFCLGAETINAGKLLEINLPVKAIKGQLLKIKWPDGLPPLPFSLVGKGYIVMSHDSHFCYAGATFEKEFQTKEPDLKIARELIMSKILPFFPPLENAEIVDCYAGLRATTASHLPLVDTLGNNRWVFTALGSKGLLWHSFLGQRLARAILEDNPDALPPPVRFSNP